MKIVCAAASLVATCGLLGGCDNTRANPAGNVAVVSPSPQVVPEPGVAPDPTVGAVTTSRSDAFTEDFDADGIADTRTVSTRTFDRASRRCTRVTEIDLDADGTIDSRSTAVTSQEDPAAC